MEVLFKKYFWLVNLTVVGICASLSGRAISHVVEGAYLSGGGARRTLRRPRLEPAAKVRSKNPEVIVKRNVFCSGCAPLVAEAPAGETSTGPISNEPQKTSLQLELVSTMVCPSDEAWSMAVLRDLSTKEKDPTMFARDSTVFSTGATVVRVVSRRVYLRNAGRLEYVELDGTAAAAAPSVPAAPAAAPAAPANPLNAEMDKGISCTGTACTVDRKLLDKLLANTAQLATSARFVPSIKDGKANGFKLYAIRPNSVFAKIGMQNGDTIKGINGNEMTSPDKALEIYTKLRNASHLSVQVERRGETTTLDYTIR